MLSKFCFLSMFLLNFIGVFSNPSEAKQMYRELNTEILPKSQTIEQIIISIEDRLTNLDNLYTSQLAPTIEMRLKQYQSRISGLETKMLRLEALLHTKLDRLADNISSRYFRDDMVQTDIFKKLETAYDGLANRLAYMGRKMETSFEKIQGKGEILLKKLEKAYDDLLSKEENIQSELTESVAGIEEIKTSINLLETTFQDKLDKKLSNYSEKQFKLSELYGKKIIENVTNHAIAIEQDVTEALWSAYEKINEKLINMNKTENSVLTIQEELSTVVNDYANKISDMNEERSQFEKNIKTKLETVEKVINSSKAENQNGIRALMIQIGKISKEYPQLKDQQLSEMSENMNEYFAKVITSQNTFLESCHRLQMDEAQLETQISNVLEKLVDNFSKTSKEQNHQIKKIENVLAKTNSDSKRDLYQIQTNLRSLFEKSSKDGKHLEELINTLNSHLDTLFALVQNALSQSENQDLHSQHPREFRSLRNKELRYMIEDIYRELVKGQKDMFDQNKNIIGMVLNISIEENEVIKSMSIFQEKLNKISEDVNSNRLTIILNDYMKDLKYTFENYNSVLNKSFLNIDKKLENLKNSGQQVNNSTNKNITDDLRTLINQVFLTANNTIKTEINCLDLDIDVRYNEESENSSRTIFQLCKNSTKIPDDQTVVFKDVNETNRLDFDMDVRFDEAQVQVTNGSKLDDFIKNNQNITDNLIFNKTENFI